mmetsp:Transcript_9205/g.30364  ORF Transcript_9205/g.30364 Transcript_9205/m.30364 type:complete len:348 (+) Transcript_9205:24-1067(+)
MFLPSSVPRECTSLGPVRVRFFGELRHERPRRLRRLLRRHLRRAEVAQEVLGRRRPREHHRRKALLREDARERERVRGHAPRSRRARELRRPQHSPVRHRFLHNDIAPLGARLCERVPDRALQYIKRGLHAVEDALAGGGVRARERAPQRRRLLSPREREADANARIAPHPCELVEHLRILEDAALEGGAVDLVQGQVRTDQGLRLRKLLLQIRERVLLNLVRLSARVHSPVRAVRVAPLARHRQVVRGEPARGEPPGEELLTSPVAARTVDVANASLVRTVEHLPTVLPHIINTDASQLLSVTEVDVAGPSKRREPKPEFRLHSAWRNRNAPTQKRWSHLHCRGDV